MAQVSAQEVPSQNQAAASTAIGQTIKGRVLDADSKYPITGAIVQVLGITPSLVAQTDEGGYFRLSKVPLGRHNLKVSLMGYSEFVMPNVLVTAGKEVVLEFKLEEKVTQKDAIEVVANKGNERLNATEVKNEMSFVSSRGFNLEETMRYAGSRNDPSRMASNFAGVQANNDGRNDIIIRGNSPIGMLWRLDGIDIPNPSHFGATGATGGPVSILNNNVLAKSDFFTGAFPAELGNAYSGAFDLNMRQGNRDKHEFLGQIGFNGFELGAEGPLGKNKKSSFLANYRYSAIGLVANLGVNVGTGSAVPYYQDLTFKTSWDVGKAGRIEVFGLGGISSIKFAGDGKDTTNLYTDPSQRTDYRTRLGVVGANYVHFLTPSTYGKLVLGATHSQSVADVDSMVKPAYTQAIDRFNDVSNVNRYTARYYLSHKFSSQATLSAGVMTDYIVVDFNATALAQGPIIPGQPRETFYRKLRDTRGDMWLTQSYAQYQYKFTDQLVANAGLHSQNLSNTSQVTLEPRAGLRYSLDEKNSFSAAYGLHSQMQPLAAYYYRTRNAAGEDITTNLNLGFTQSHHYVVGYNRVLGNATKLRVEAYYQDIFNVPIEQDSSSYSMLNHGADFSDPEVANLVNKGRGQNWGVEVTLERTFSNGYYFLVTGSLYDSKYLASDGLWRNTAFNNRWLVNILGGYELKATEKLSFSLDLKLTTGGGRYFTPYDVARSQQLGYGVRNQDQVYASRFQDYFRLDVKLGARHNMGRLTQEFFVDIQNITNQQNPFVMTWNQNAQREVIIPQLGLSPNVNYRVTF